MPLSIGDKLGPYQIVAPLGAGGMGEVYRARDSKLNREVAIKVLPAALANDADYLARFQREAQALAALHHPNIASIFGLEGNAIVMELVEGQTLRGPLPLAEALPIARQIAEALEAAHDKGIIHRDLKPGNILLTADGVVKVLDFGLAKAVERTTDSSQNSPTLTLRATEAGLILGTAGYMSPEQAAGKPVDRRADIWSFGVVFWELLTGKRLFDGETISHTLAEVLKEPIDLTLIPAGPVRELIGRCLDRNLKTRLQHIGEARIAIEHYHETPPQKAATSKLPWLATAAAAMVAAALGVLHFTQKPPAPFAGVFEIDLPRIAALIDSSELSPDGRYIASHTNAGILIRDLHSTERRIVPLTERNGQIGWSPDSASLVFAGGQKINKVAIDGGAPQTLCDYPPGPAYPAWSPDGTVLFSGAGGALWKVPAAGGTPARVTLAVASDSGEAHMRPVFLPDGRQFLFLVVSSKAETDGVYVASLDGPPDQRGKRVLDSRFSVLVAQDENGGTYLLYRKGTVLFAQAFDTRALVLKGAAFEIAPKVGNIGPVLLASISNRGALLLSAAGQSLDSRQFSWFDRGGKRVEDVGPIGAWVDSALSPDGRKLAATRYETNNEMNVWTMDLRPDAVPARFTFEPTRFLRWLLWSPDSKRLLFTPNTNTDGGGTYEKPGDGTGAQRPVPGVVGVPTDISPDGQSILSHRSGDLWIHSSGKPTQLTQTAYTEMRAKFSPDGKWIAYESFETGRSEVWVQNIPPTGVRFQISTEGGQIPQWRRDGKELFYKGADGELIAVAVKAAPSFEAGARSVLFPLDALNFNASADGQRFLIPAPIDLKGSETTPFLLRTHWTLGVKR